jgi:hypothetical protein
MVAEILLGINFSAKKARWKSKKNSERLQRELYRDIMYSVKNAFKEGRTDVTTSVYYFYTKEQREWVTEKLEKKGFTVEWASSGYIITIKWEK